ncbi:porin, partial [Pigmentiphaga sp. GD03639]|uniref:porin n=1 Tax=Pigmentiphaga sp. GD03639 TaxID=2975354 RepID=UPI0024474F4C
VTPTRNDDTAWTLGFSAPLRKGKLLGSYQTATKSEVKQWALGYQYNLSKRTDLYSFFTSTDYRNFTESRNFSGRQFALGLQHRF